MLGMYNTVPLCSVGLANKGNFIGSHKNIESNIGYIESTYHSSVQLNSAWTWEAGIGHDIMIIA